MKLLKTNLAFALLLSLSLSSPGRAEVLWDQSTLDLAGPGIANSYSPGFGGFVIHSVDDVTVAGSGWNVEKITQYYSTWNPNWTSITTGYLHVAPKTGPLPTFNPSTDIQVPMSASYLSGDVLKVTAAGLNIPLAPGDYWIGITPVAGAGIFGANLQWSAALVATTVANWELGVWHNYYAGYDGAILIEGSRPVAVESGSWGDIKSLYR